jgi:hypothetical protein
MSFRGKPIDRVHENEKVKTIENTQQLLRILLREICDCPHKQEHIDGLRHALIEEHIVATASEELEHAARNKRLFE